MSSSASLPPTHQRSSLINIINITVNVSAWSNSGFHTPGSSSANAPLSIGYQVIIGITIIIHQQQHHHDYQGIIIKIFPIPILMMVARVKLVCHTDWSGMVIPLGPDLILLVVCTYYAVVTR